MQYFPINLKLNKHNVLVVGAGAVGLRKVASLLSCSPKSLVLIDIKPVSLELKQIQAQYPSENFIFKQVALEPEHILACSLVFACTNSREINSMISGICTTHNILCNIVDAPDEGSFIVSAHFSKESLMLSISTSGESPALAKYLRQELETFVSERFIKILKFMGLLRPMLLELGLASAQNAEIFRALVRSELPELLNKTALDEAAIILHQYLPEPLHKQIKRLLHDCS